MPASESVLCNFVSYLSLQGLTHGTIRVYLSAVRSFHIYNGYASPLEEKPRLKLVMKAIFSEGKAPVKKLPITYDLLCKLIEAHIFPAGYSGVLYRAVLSLLFFGGMRAGEVLIKGSFDAKRHLSLYSIIVFSSHMSVTLQKTKTTDQPVSFNIPCTGGSVCGFCYFVAYYGIRLKMSPIHVLSPLFVNESGTGLTYKVFQKFLNNLLSYVGVDPRKYSGHSFRAGLATQAGLKGLPDYAIQMLGRWESVAFKGYIHQSLEQTRSIFHTLLH